MYIGSAIGGMNLTTTIEGRERFPVRVRYARELRDNPEDLKKVLIPTPSGVQVPLGELSEIIYTRGPQLIKCEDTFLVGYVKLSSTYPAFNHWDNILFSMGIFSIIHDLEILS